MSQSRVVIAAARLLGAVLLAGTVAACQDNAQLAQGRAWRPISSEMTALMQSKGTDARAPMLIRAFKKEAELEIWKMRADGTYAHLKTFPMCRWSGQLGPKTREGDRQVPEGFYSITPGMMNPNSAYYLSFNVGYPNSLDRAMGHSGGAIMVHGACSSAGCFSMTDEQIADIYALARESFGGGQRAIQMQSFPFRMTVENLAKHRLDPNIAFWRNLKQGSDHFEVSKVEPVVGACGRKYVFDVANAGALDPAAPCPALKPDGEMQALVAEKASRDEDKIADLVAKGVKPVKVVYADGGQHAEFASRAMAEVSRPDALAQGATEIALNEPKAKSPVVALAAAKAAKDLAAKDLAAKRAAGKTEVARFNAKPDAPTASIAKDGKGKDAVTAASSSVAKWTGARKGDAKPEAEDDSKTATKPAGRPAKPQASLGGKPFYGAGEARDNLVALEPARR